MRTNKQCNWKSDHIHKLRNDRKVKERNREIVQGNRKLIEIDILSLGLNMSEEEKLRIYKQIGYTFYNPCN